MANQTVQVVQFPNEYALCVYIGGQIWIRRTGNLDRTDQVVQMEHMERSGARVFIYSDYASFTKSEEVYRLFVGNDSDPVWKASYSYRPRSESPIRKGYGDL